MSTISASTASNTAFKVTSDTTGTLVFQTGAVPTTAISISASQVVSIGNIAVTGATTFAAGSAAAPSITTTGDTNTGIFFPAADTIGFTEGGVEAARIDSSGNLGIGTSSWPSGQRLRVAGGDVGLEGQFLYLVNANADIQMGAAQNAKITNTDSTNTLAIARTGASSIITFSTAGSERARIDSSGNLGLGVTPSAWYTTGGTSKWIEMPSGVSFGDYGGSTTVGNNWFANSAGTDIYKITGYAVQYVQTSGTHVWKIAGVGNSGDTITFTQAMTLNTSGNLGIGTTSPTTRLHINGTGGQYLRSFSTNNSVDSYFGSQTNDATVYVASNHPLTFATNNTERARITAAGYSKFSNNGTYANATGANHEFKQNAADWVAFFTNTNAAPLGLVLAHSTDSNGTGNEFLYCQGGVSTLRASIRSNGGLANYSANNVNLSDERTKKDIVPLGSVWDKFKTIEIVKFKYRDQTHDDYNIGVIAQQVESVAPEFVDVDGWGETPEDGVPFKTVYTTDMYHAAIKALQEAMARIEQLEAKFAALESK